jgi:hypothetical protein
MNEKENCLPVPPSHETCQTEILRQGFLGRLVSNSLGPGSLCYGAKYYNSFADDRLIANSIWEFQKSYPSPQALDKPPENHKNTLCARVAEWVDALDLGT